MDISAIKNSPGMWIASGIMVLVIIVQAVLFMRAAKKEAGELGIPVLTEEEFAEMLEAKQETADGE